MAYKALTDLDHANEALRLSKESNSRARSQLAEADKRIAELTRENERLRDAERIAWAMGNRVCSERDDNCEPHILYRDVDDYVDDKDLGAECSAHEPGTYFWFLRIVERRWFLGTGDQPVLTPEARAAIDAAKETP